MGLKKLKGNISISRVTSTCEDDFVSIQIQDNNSRGQFLRIKMTFADFAKALLNQGHVPLEFEVSGLQNVGKIKLSKPLAFPLETTSYNEVREEAMKRAQFFVDGGVGSGWIADTYFGNKDSFVKHEDGKTWAHGMQHKYVEVKDEETS